MHYYLDDTPYFITAATYKHQKLLDAEIKGLLRDLLQSVFAEYGWRLDHWVILDDHYHLLGSSRRGRDLPRIIGKVHNQSAQQVNLRHPPSRRLHAEVWCNYWDYCPRDERDYRVRLCYLLDNPVKHGYVRNLHLWPWSSFGTLFEREEDAGMRRMFREHRAYRDLRLPEDDF